MYVVAMPQANQVISFDVYIMSRGARHKGCCCWIMSNWRQLVGVGRDASIAIAICKEKVWILASWFGDETEYWFSFVKPLIRWDISYVND